MSDAAKAHLEDPCMSCGISHDTVPVGPCPAIIRIRRSCSHESAYEVYCGDMLFLRTYDLDAAKGYRDRVEKEFTRALQAERAKYEHHWTTTPPTKPGWYWYRMTKLADSSVVRLIATEWSFKAHHCSGIVQDVKTMDGEWIGPIEPPKDGESCERV